MRRRLADRIAACLLSAALGLGAGGCGSPDMRPIVVLITTDTTRADHLGCYGAAGARTPNIDVLASEGTRFATAVTPVPITLPSHTTILSGLTPPFHGVRDNAIYRLGPDVPILPAILKARGYETAAFVGAAVLDAQYGLSRGFDHYDDNLEHGKARSRFSFVERRAEDVTRAAMAWLEHHGEGPFLLWAHYFDPHMGYDPPSPYREEFADRPYDGEIAYTDHWIGELRAAVARRADGRPVLTVLVADHGEGLGEHGEKTHGLFLYDATLHVPLIVAFPGRVPGGRVVPDLVATDVVLPTVLDLLGVPIPEGVRAPSAVPLVDGTGTLAPRTIFLETALPKNLIGWSPIDGLRTTEWKYVELPKPELYDLRNDPGETTNLVAERSAETATLREELVAYRAAAPATDDEAPAATVDAATQQRLGALGYIVGRERGGSVARQEPQDLVALFEALYRASGFMSVGQWDDAIAALDELLALHPRHVGAMLQRGDAHWRRALEGAGVEWGGGPVGEVVLDAQGRDDFAEAERWYERAAEVDPTSARAHFGLGRLHGYLGELDAALAEYRRALELGPDSPETLSEIGLVYAKQGRLKQAAKEFKRAITQNRYFAPAHRYLGALARGLGLPRRALREYQRAARTDPWDPGVRFLLGNLLRDLGRPEEAVAQYEAALEIDPDAFYAHQGLGVLLQRRGDREGARPHFEEAVRLAPGQADSHLSLGMLDAEDGKLAEAEKHYLEALRLRPDLLQAQVNLALLYRQQGEPARATKALERALVLAPQDERLRQLLADVQRETSE